MLIPSALPQKLDCPGGSEVWKNVTIQGNNRICHDQRNSCNGSLGLGMDIVGKISCAWVVTT